MNETETMICFRTVAILSHVLSKKKTKTKNPKINDSSFSFPADYISEDKYKEMSRK